MNYFVHPATHNLAIQVDDPFLIRDLVPESRTLIHPNYNITVHHTFDTVRMLRNLGYQVPAPIDLAYDWPGKFLPMAHQREMVEFMATHSRCFNLSEMGTMKTAAALWAADKLMKEGLIKKVLVIPPLSILVRVWQQELFDVLMHRVCSIVHGTREQRAAALAVNADFYILNHDGVAIGRTYGPRNQFMLGELMKSVRDRQDINLVIVDEGQAFRNSKTDRYRALKAMLRPDQRVWWMTGGPCPNAPTDAWAQARIICPERVPTFFGSFRRETMMEISEHRWKPRVGSSLLAFNAMQPAIRFMKKDCIELPPVVTINLDAQLTKEQRIAYKAMHTFMVTEAKGQKISAVNAADRIGKLRQILCGSIKDPITGEYLTYDHGPRLEVLKEVIDGASAKVLVVVPFKGIIEALDKELSKDYTVGVLNGDVSINVRNRIISEFKNGVDPHLLLCHPRVMAHGLNLTEADTLIFYAPIYSNDETQQVVERFNRVGQTRKMTIARIGAHALEWSIYGLIDSRKISQDSILDLYRRTIGEAA